MVDIVEPSDDLVKEYENFKNIELRCKHCDENFADFRHVKRLDRQFWQISRDDVNWDAAYTVQGSIVLCCCGERLGDASVVEIFKLYKKAFKLFY